MILYTRTGRLLLFLIASAAAEVQPRCGDCWCVTFGDANFDSCPTDATGITDTFPDEFDVYAGFQLANDPDFLKLRTPDGPECYPFATTLGPVQGYPESNLPQCAIPVSTADTVCAYKFESDVPCRRRNYEIITYDSAAAAEVDGAKVTHSGACGVCSNAQDLWARMKTIDSFDTETLACALEYLVGASNPNRFEQLIQCAVDAGLSYECATLWSHMGAATVSQCFAECASVSSLQGPPPRCEAAACLTCPESFNENFNAIAGRTMVGSGIPEVNAQYCSDFYRVIHDPCIDATESWDMLPPTEAPTDAPSTQGTPSSSPGSWLSSRRLVGGAISVALVLWAL